MYNPNVMCLSETRLQTTHVLRKLGNYTIIREDANLFPSGRGVAILVSDLLNYKEINLKSKGFSWNIEVVCAQIQFKSNKSFIVCCIYRHPLYDSITLSNDNDAFSHIFAELFSFKKPIFILGDFNLRDKRSFGPFKKVLSQFNLTQIIDEPTRGSNILDLVITSNTRLVGKTTVFDPNLSDHACTSCSLNIKKPKDHKIS